MRLPKFPAGVVLGTLVPEAVAVPGGDGDHPLAGSWSATRWQYSSRAAPGRAVDVVCDLGGSVTLSLSAGTWVLTVDIAGRARQSVGGTWNAATDRLELHAATLPRPVVMGYRLGAGELVLHMEGSEWDFDGDGTEEPAGFVAVFVRL